MGSEHPIALPIALCRPDRVKGMPIFLESLAFCAEIPRARFHEKEKPNFLPILITSH
jgi:hypothetical protein